jgi:hypothetical protein
MPYTKARGSYTTLLTAIQKDCVTLRVIKAHSDYCPAPYAGCPSMSRQSDTVEGSERVKKERGKRVKTENDEMLMSWQTDGPLKYQPSCMRTRMEKNCWTSVETRKRMAYNPWAHTDAQHTGRMRTHRERKKEKKNRFKKLTWWASATRLLLTVSNVPLSFLIPLPYAPRKKGSWPLP